MIHQLFEKQVEINPNGLAIVYKDKQLTYAELNREANKFAHTLIDKYEIKPETCVPILMERSEKICFCHTRNFKSRCLLFTTKQRYSLGTNRLILLKKTNAPLVITDEFMVSSPK